MTGLCLRTSLGVELIELACDVEVAFPLAAPAEVLWFPAAAVEVAFPLAAPVEEPWFPAAGGGPPPEGRCANAGEVPATVRAANTIRWSFLTKSSSWKELAGQSGDRRWNLLLRMPRLPAGMQAPPLATQGLPPKSTLCDFGQRGRGFLQRRLAIPFPWSNPFEGVSRSTPQCSVVKLPSLGQLAQSDSRQHA